MHESRFEISLVGRCFYLGVPFLETPSYGIINIESFITETERMNTGMIKRLRMFDNFVNQRYKLASVRDSVIFTMVLLKKNNTHIANERNSKLHSVHRIEIMADHMFYYIFL